MNGLGKKSSAFWQLGEDDNEDSLPVVIAEAAETGFTSDNSEIILLAGLGMLPGDSFNFQFLLELWKFSIISDFTYNLLSANIGTYHL